MSAKLRPGFEHGLVDGRKLLGEVVQSFSGKGEQDLLMFLSAIAAFVGQPEVTAMLWNLDTIHCPKCEELIETCSECGAEFDAMELYSREF